MSKHATKARNQKIKSKQSLKTRIRKAFWLMVLAYLIWLLIQSVFGGSRTITIINETLAAQEAQQASEIEQYDPCGLEVVQCNGEVKKAVPQGKFEAKEEIIKKIKTAFPEQPEIAVKMAMCESSLIVDKLGDEALAFEHDGELLGRSRGLFQIRTGGKEKNGKVWNRAKANGMTVKAFEEKMTIADENIKYAREIYNGRGWAAWENCAIEVGVL